MPQKEGESYITEFALIQKAQKGDTEALEKLIDWYYDNIFSYLFRKVGSIELAEDLTQEVFLRLVKTLSRYRPTGKFSNYVFTIAVNAANDYFRKNKLFIHEELNSVDIDAGIDIEGILIEQEQHIRLKEALEKLPDMQKDAILLRYFHNMKIKNIAKITGTNPSTVKSRISQGLNKLKIILLEDESEWKIINLFTILYPLIR